MSGGGWEYPGWEKSRARYFWSGKFPITDNLTFSITNSVCEYNYI